MQLNVEMLNKYKNLLLNVLIIIVAGIIAGNIYKAQSLKVVSLERQKDAETKKNEVLGDISGLEKKIGSYKEFINKKDIASIINTINRIAQESSVKITAIKPQREIGEDRDYLRYPFVLTVDAGDYHALGKFIAKLESSADIYNIDSLNINSVTTSGHDAKQPEGVVAGITISSFLLK